MRILYKVTAGKHVHYANSYDNYKRWVISNNCDLYYMTIVAYA